LLILYTVSKTLWRAGSARRKAPTDTKNDTNTE
jgi:hypothetical protein